MDICILQQLLPSKKPDNVQVYGSLESYRSLQKSEGGAIVDTEAPVHLQLTSIVPPDDAELVYLFGMTCHKHGNKVIGMLCKDEGFLKL